MKHLISKPKQDYQLLDSGFGKKLEMIGGIRVERPSPQAIWAPRLSENEWKKATSICVRQKDGGGHWKHLKEEPTGLFYHWKNPEDKNLRFKLKFTSFGHCGIFFEQEPVWQLLSEEAIRVRKEIKRPLKFLNLFAYTGGASMALASLGAEVFHVDSAKGVLNWGRDNQRQSDLASEHIHFVQQDIREFLKHSIRKGFKYDAILADPPSWGHGANKEVWEFEDNIQEFVNDCYRVLNREKSFFFLSSHTHGVQHEALRNLMSVYPGKKNVEVGEISVAHHPEKDDRLLPAGIFSFASNIQ